MDMDNNVRLFLKTNHRTYDIWGHSVLVLMIISYTMYFLVRQNFSLAMPFIEGSLGFSKTEIGIIMTASLFVFGVGKFINGFFNHLLRPKVFLSLGLVGSSLMNIAFAKSSSLLEFSIVWSFNAFFQSIAWPQCVRLMSEWYSPTQLGTRWGLVGMANQAGSFLVFAFFTFLIESYGWRASFLIPGIAGIIAGLVILALPLEVPKDLGLCSMEERHGLPIDRSSGTQSTFRQISWTILSEILKNKFLWYISLATFFIYIVKTGFCSWAPTYLKEAKSLGIKSVGFNMVVFEIAGAFGGLMAGWLSDKVFKGRRGHVGVIYLVGMMILLAALWLAPLNVVGLDVLLLAGLGFVLFGPQVMAGAASVDFSSKQAAVAANGFVGFFSYFGSSMVSGVFLGYVTQHYGWSATFIILIISSAMAAFFFWKTLAYHQRSIEKNTIEGANQRSKEAVNLS
jgi:sugar phosphate permease